MQQQVRDRLSVTLPAVPPPAVFNLHGKKGNLVFPSSLPFNEMLLFCFSICFDEAILILVPCIWKRVCYF